MTIRVLVWGENRHEQVEPHVAEIYPDGMHNTIAAGISENLGDEAKVATTTFDEPEHGLTEEVLADTDVLVWWGHAAHGEVEDKVVERVHRHVLSGMGLVVLHSGHWSKIFGKLMGTSCTLRWRSEHDRELVWTVEPDAPDRRRASRTRSRSTQQEMYGEFFDIPRAGRTGLRQHLQRRRGVPLRLHLPPRPRQDLLLLARRPGLPGLPPQGRPQGDRERRRLGDTDRAGAGGADAAALRDRRLLQRPRVPGRSRAPAMPDPAAAPPGRRGRDGPRAGSVRSADTRTSNWSAWSTSTWTSPRRPPTSTELATCPVGGPRPS